MNVIEILKKATGNAPETVETLTSTIQTLEESIASQERVLAAREASRGADLLAAKTAGDGMRIEGFIQADRDTLSQMRAAHIELVARLGTAKAIRAQQELDTAWDACEAALRARRVAFEELTKAATALGKAQLKAEKAAQHAFDMLPVRTVTPAHSAPYRFERQWTDLTGTVAMMVAVASHDPASGITDSTVWAHAQQPTLLQQHDEAAAHWLSARKGPSFNSAA